jgi:hypothetical protein
MIPAFIAAQLANKAIPWRLIGVGVVVLALAGAGAALYFNGRSAGKDAVQADWDKAKAAQAVIDAKELKRVLDGQQALQADISKLREEGKANEDRIRRLHGAVVDSLRNRPTERAPTGIPDAASAGVAGCTGAGLARPDAEFLAGYAADAARLAGALAECRAGYQAAKDKLDRLSTGQ